MNNSNRSSANNSRNNNQQHASSMPMEQGIIHTLLDKFGFITCADRERELFFHYSEFRGHSEDLNIGDEVEFFVGRAEERGRRGGGGGSSIGGGGGDNDKWSAFSIKKLPSGTIQWEKEDEPVGKRYKGTVQQVARDESFQRRGGERGGGMRDRGGGSRSGGSVGAVDGAIQCICIGDDSENEVMPEIYYTSADCAKSNSLHRNDIVEFTLVTQRRTKKKYARDITLLQSERERLNEAKEKKLMQDATLERGIVASISNNSSRGGRDGGSDGGYSGILKSVNRSEEVYFNASHVVNLDENEGNVDSVGGDTIRDVRKSTLKEGQEVEFYVVNEAGPSGSSGERGRASKSGGKSSSSISARQIKILPKGSVKFQHTIAKGVTGIVMTCPVANVDNPSFGFGRSGGGRKGGDRGGGGKGGGGGQGGKENQLGKIHLQQPITVDNPKETKSDQNNTISEVSLRPENYPGGTFAISRTGSEMGTWIRPNDVLLFDVVQMVVDGACFAVPTLAETNNVNGANTASASEINGKPAIRLIEPSPCTRAHGTIRSIHDNYGFIQLAERSGSGQSDAYFPLFEVFPGELQQDLVRNTVAKDEDVDIDKDGDEVNDGVEKDGAVVQRKESRIHVEVGMEVAFDLSLQMLTNNPSSDRMGSARGDRGGRYSNNKQEKESLRARRVQIIPKGTVIEKIPIVSGVKAMVAKDDTKRGQKQQPFVGTLELEETIKIDIDSNNRLRHPLVARLVDAVSEGKYGDEGVTFHDVISDRDAQVVISMVNGRDDLEWSYVVPGHGDGVAVVGDNGRKLCIAKKKCNVDEAEEESPVVIESSGDEKEVNVNEEKPEGIVDDVAPTSTGGRQDSPKKKAKKVKIIKSVRFDKFSFPDMSIGSLGAGDVVTCDIFQSRQTGAFMVENITVLERIAIVPEDRGGDDGNKECSQRKGLSGFVTEALPSRQFGFITGVDEQGSKTGEHVFFHFREVQSSGADNNEIAQDGSLALPPPSRGKKRNNNVVTIRKGDEVKFDVEHGKNGKLNATNIIVLPRGTLKLIPINKSSDNTCTGYILMEPSHTSLANTPSHNIGLQSGPAAAGVAGSRWANVRDDKTNKPGSHVKEEGVILLLSDPSHLFSAKPKVDSPPAKLVVPSTGEASPNDDNGSDSVAGSADSASEANDAAVTNSENKNVAVKDNDQSQSIQSVAVGTHLRYSLGSTAPRTSGPKRGDLVSFGKTRGAKLAKDIRIEKMGAATSLRGIIEDIDVDNDTAVFVSSPLDDTNVTEKYEIKLTEVVSCNKALLKDKEIVDGILYEGKVFGVCRTKDIHLGSSFGRNSSGSSGGLKERPKLNLTVKKELQGMGGKIMAQSRLATGPDGTNGFTPGWTKRVSLHDVVNDEDEDDAASSLSRELSAAASEFVPNFSVAASGFEMSVLDADAEEGANGSD